MNFVTTVDTIVTTSVVTIPLGMALPWIVRLLARKLAGYARPRFLVSHGVRCRTPHPSLKR